MSRATALLVMYACWMLFGAAPHGCLEATFQQPAPGIEGLTPFPIQVSLSELIPTVATVDWALSVEQDADAWVEFSAGGGWARSDAVVRQGDGFSCILLGLSPLSEYRVRAVVVTEQQWRTSMEAAVLTGALPAAFPDMQMDFEPDEDGSDGYLVTSFIGAFSAAVILDLDGNAVWWHEPAESLSKVSRAALSRDGQSILYLWEEQAEDSEIPPARPPYLVRVAMDGSSVVTFAADGAHHDFVELPDGKLAVLAHDKRSIEGWDKPVLGDRIEEYAANGGEPEVVWSSFDSWAVGGGPTVEGYIDWTHGNAINYDLDSDTYSVSLNHLRTIATIDRQSGELVEQVGGDESDYSFIESGERSFGPQHQFQFVDGGLLVFDNGTPQDYESRAVEFALDPTLSTAELSWSHTASPPLFCPCQGDVSRLPGGNTLVTWSTSGQLDEITPDGEVLRQLKLELGTVLGYTTFEPDLGLPDGA